MLAYVMEKTNYLKPLFDRVLLRPVDEQKSEHGIIIPRSASERSHLMQVAAVGQTNAVKIGDNVIVAKYAGTEVTLGTEKFLLVCEYDILGVVS